MKTRTLRTATFTGIGVLVAGAATAATLILTSGPSDDEIFFTSLTEAGVSVTDEGLLRDIGTTVVCGTLDDGHTRTDAYNALVSVGGYTTHEAHSITAAAIDAYCPEHT